jgi:hypothetical protein
MRASLLAALTAAASLLTSAACAATFTFAAIGDVPYGPPEELSALAADLNRQSLLFTLHLGDIKTGTSRCSDDTYLKVRALFNEFHQPLVYTPGDNEWTDCHRTLAGGYDPLERLEKLRGLFFATAESHGQQKLPLQSQRSDAHYARYVENLRWQHGKITFATLHIVGSNNNWQPDLPSVSEFAARDEANRAWLHDTFSTAKARSDVAVVLAMQADTFMTAPGPASGFTRWLQALADEVARWGKPVLLLQGDSHQFRIDRPLRGTDGKPLTNLLRVVVPGERHADAVLVDIDESRSNEPFRVRLMGTGKEHSAQR